MINKKKKNENEEEFIVNDKVNNEKLKAIDAKLDSINDKIDAINKEYECDLIRRNSDSGSITDIMSVSMIVASSAIILSTILELIKDHKK